MKLILSYFKSYLPSILIKKKDCRGRFIKMDRDDIGVALNKEPGDFVALLVPTDDLSEYPDSNYFAKNPIYAFQWELRARDIEFEGAVENMIILKSAVETLMTNIDYNLGLNVELEGFNWGGLIEGQNTLTRRGIYRFSVIGKMQARKT